MAGFQRIIIMGNLGSDPEMRFTPVGKPVASFSVAVNENETEWFNVVTWNKVAETCNEHLSKGKSVLIEGKLKTRQWEAEGIKHYRTELIASRVVFISKKEGKEETTETTELWGDSELPF